MANTVTLLSFANTFGDWVVTTNKLAQENNDLAANNYIKPTGTLFLNSPSLGLQVANNATIQGQLQVSGIGSSAYIQKNLQVDGSIIGASNNYFIASDSNNIFNITQSGSGLAIRINSQPGGSGVTGQNTTVIDANGNVYIGSATAGPLKLNVQNGNVNFANNLTVGFNVTSQIVRTTNHVVSKDVTASANVLGDRLQANTNLISPTLVVSGTAYVNAVQANSSVNTTTFTTTTAYGSNYVSAGQYIWAPVITASSTVRSNNLIANTSVTSPFFFVSDTLDANGSDIYVDSLVANTISVQGNFVVNGDTVYNSDTLTINADAAVPQNGTFGSFRGPGNANAEIRWNEILDYWEVRDISTLGYSRILIANLISDSTNSTSSSTVASSLAANTILSYLQGVDNTQNTNITAINTFAQAAFNSANTGGGAAGNTIALQAQMNTTNTNITSVNVFAQAAFNRANTGGGTFVGTSGVAVASNGVISFNSGNGLTVSGTANVLTVNTSQDLRSTASPTFASLTLSSPLALAQGGTGGTSATGALTSLLPSGAVAGYVLTTGGVGNYYWAAGGGGGGGGATPGTTINSTRLSYTASGTQVTYTTPTFSAATQLRAYINGVRQFESEYTANISNSTISFTVAPSLNDAILLEVDGFINNPYYANNIAFTSPQGGIDAGANTIQLAINDLESRKATLASPTFIGYPLAPTADIAVSNTQIATTAYVNNLANSGITFSHSVTGSAGSVANTGIVGLVGPRLSDETASSDTRYITFTSQTSGVLTVANTSSSKLTYVPSTGTLSSTVMTSTSDINQKINIVEIADALNTIMQLKGVEYNWKDTGDKGMGLIAQDVEKIIPYLVSENENGKSIMYQNMVGLLIEAIKELKREIDSLKGDNK
jgi:hypothetical protein